MLTEDEVDQEELQREGGGVTQADGDAFNLDCESTEFHLVQAASWWCPSCDSSAMYLKIMCKFRESIQFCAEAFNQPREVRVFHALAAEAALNDHFPNPPMPPEKAVFGDRGGCRLA